jgi:hypothetical protein
MPLAGEKDFVVLVGNPDRLANDPRRGTCTGGPGGELPDRLGDHPAPRSIELAGQAIRCREGLTRQGDSDTGVVLSLRHT